MSVAVQNEPEVKSTEPAMGFAAATLAGAAFVVFGFVAVYYLIPWAWRLRLAPGEALGAGGAFLELLLMIAGAIGLIFLWRKSSLARQDKPGLRAAIGSTVLWAVLGLLLVYWSALLAEKVTGWFDFFKDSGWVVGVLAAGAAAFYYFRWLVRRANAPKFDDRMQALEEQGWYSMKSYKKGQGLRIRRFTMLGILILVGAGLWVYTHGQLTPGGVYTLHLPFDAQTQIPLIRSPGVVVPLAIALFSIWFAYRLVNYSRFADFLIATEAEMHKVSWATWKKIKQDTVVVLVVLLIMTVFLFSMDALWAWLLRLIGVLQVGK